MRAFLAIPVVAGFLYFANELGSLVNDEFGVSLAASLAIMIIVKAIDEIEH